MAKRIGAATNASAMKPPTCAPVAKINGTAVVIARSAKWS